MIRAIIAAAFCSGAIAHAASYGNVRGMIHDPDHRPIQAATVGIRAVASEWRQTTTTDAEGAFEFDSVPVGSYNVSASSTGFATLEQPLVVTSSSAQLLHLQLRVAAASSESVVVQADPELVDPSSSTATTLIDRSEIDRTPGASLSNSLSAITDYVPGAYVTHDQLHLRGGHQASWAIDGVPIPNTNIATNVGPQLDPKDIDYLEVLRGGYGADYGDRTYGVFNVVPRTGFERNSEGELRVTAGQLNQTNDQLSLGSHTQRMAYYVSLSGSRSDYGLQPPVAQILHDQESGFGGFGSLIFNHDAANQFRLATSARTDFYEIPDDPSVPGISDVEREIDSFAALSWIHSFAPGVQFTLSPFFHYNSANFIGSPNDVPLSTNDDRTSVYFGGQASLAVVSGRHNARVAVYAFGQNDHENVHLLANDGSGSNFGVTTRPSGNLEALFLEDRYRALSWLTLTAGIRLTRFSGNLQENVGSPRFGVAIRVPKLNWVFRGFYGRYYQAPPLTTITGPAVDFAVSQGLGFLPLHGERDEEYQFGVAIPWRGWSLDVNHFQTNASNFFDHNSLGNSNIFFPLTIDAARIRGWEVTLRSPRILRRGELHLAYSYQHAVGRGAINGGLTDFSPPSDEFLLDHDQRHTLNTGVNVNLLGNFQASSNVYYGSGFADDGGPHHLLPHTTFDVSLARSLGERWAFSVTALNASDRRVLLDNSFTFGGTHYNDPRQVYVEIRYRFHY